MICLECISDGNFGYYYYYYFYLCFVVIMKLIFNVKAAFAFGCNTKSSAVVVKSSPVAWSLITAP
jgi:hypothetical protein